ncbi:MAG: adenylate/guanylate cyclase domain-containing protein [Actinomycetia bacterium]|nr:adenylate/guanylate cyclase domain-containing protein [Actinomycetes bacterium]
MSQEYFSEDEKLEVVRLLGELGASPEHIASILENPLQDYPPSMLFGRRATLSAVGLSSETGMDLSEVHRLYRLCGVPFDDVDEIRFGHRDVALCKLFHLVGAGFMPIDERDDLFRLVGASIARISEGSIASYSQVVEVPIWDDGFSAIESIRSLHTGVQVVEQMADGISGLLRHHFAESTERQRLAQATDSNRLLYRSAVGFIDLVGFTAISRKMSIEELASVVREFEARAFDIVTDFGGRVVKHIGDEVMFTAPTVESGCAAVLGLIDGFSDERVQPRGGLAFGDMLTRGGDHYGPVVNLASRLGDHAVPGEVLCDAGVAEGIGDRYVAEPAGRRQLKGFDEPIRVWSLSHCP